ncbi:uncharacterized protein LOC132173002 [Corylus avellana]|uniref:uncharacterized protein LOC132173002 n=1 Tax=Corylus avellana TaxID=13451 RepID=UPI00286CA654|nr:uncharacterized protein LOC132173002 [Corylus avellana]
MAASSELSGAHLPVRSISLPSRTQPSSVRLEEVLNTIKSCQISSVSTAFPVGAETIQTGLAGLAELYNCLEELIHSPLTRQALLCHEHRKLVEEILEGSITLLDTCGTARDIIFTMKEHVQTLQSALRRKGVDSRIESDIHAYMLFRKKVKKDVAKCLKELKRTERKVSSSPLLDLDLRLSMAIGVLREASAITMSIFRSLLLFLSVPAMETNAARWSSLVSRLMPATARLLSCEKGQKIINEVGSVDVALCSLHGHLRNKDAKAEVQLAQRMLEKLHLSINDVEDGLDCLFRCLLQNRVSFLNILAN